MLKDFSEPVNPNFRIKFCLDTNILKYYLDTEFPCLNKAIDNLVEHDAFVDLVTTRYVLFELLEVRKRNHFVSAVNATLGASVFYRTDLKAKAWFSLLWLPSKVIGWCSGNQKRSEWLQRQKAAFVTEPLSEKNMRIFNLPGSPKYYYSLLPQIKTTILSELNSLKNNTDINLVGDIHQSLWEPTEHICLSSRLSREDSLVMTSTMMPDPLIIEDFVTIVTNDKLFNDFVFEAPNLDAVFISHSLKRPDISYIQKLINFDGHEFNLTVHNEDSAISEFLNSYIKKMIIEKNKHLYIGKTDHTISGGNIYTVGLRLYEHTSIKNTNYLVIISKDLDYTFNCPVIITDYRNSTSTTEPFPVTGAVGKVVFKWPAFDPSDPLHTREAEILTLIKQSGNLVFIHPDSYTP